MATGNNLLGQVGCLLSKECHEPRMLSRAYDSRTGELEAGGGQEFKVSFSCTLSLRSAWSTWGVLGQSEQLCSKNKNKKQKGPKETSSWAIAGKPPGPSRPDTCCFLYGFPVHWVACAVPSAASELGHPCFSGQKMETLRAPMS